MASFLSKGFLEFLLQNSKDFKRMRRNKITPVFSIINLSICPRKDMSDKYPIRKKGENMKFKYSPQKKNSNEHNQVFVKEFKFGLLSLRS